MQEIEKHIIATMARIEGSINSFDFSRQQLEKILELLGEAEEVINQ